MSKWANLGTDVMKEARERLGLSYETVARKIPVASKTYERYEKAGRVPQPLLSKVADVLELKIERTAPVTVEIPADQEEEAASRLAASAGQILAAVGRLEKVVDRLEGLPPAQAGD